MERIFVQMLSRDGIESQALIDELFGQATSPQRIIAGLCFIGDTTSAQLLVPAGLEATQLRIYQGRCDVSESIGRARRNLQTLWDGEEFVLSIDSRVSFTTAWDDHLIKQLALCKADKPALTARKSKSLTQPGPQRVAFVRADNLFSRSTILHDVPPDPELDAADEELALAVRLYTSGYDVFEPDHAIIDGPDTAFPSQASDLVRERSRARLHEIFEQGHGSDAARSLAIPPVKTSVLTTYPEAVLKKQKPVFDTLQQPRFGPAAIVDGAPPGILIMRNYIDDAACRQLVAYANAQPSKPLGVGVYDDTATKAATFRKDALRVTEEVRIDGMACEILNLFNDIYCHRVAPFYNVAIAAYERPQILRYPVGGQYLAHADADIWDENTKSWMRVLFRDYSVLLYINDDYEGGSLHFLGSQYTLRPESGMLVAFPSDYTFMHEAQPTTAGIRYAIVSWGITTNTKPAKNPYLAVHIPVMQSARTEG